jgi:hypothetical protein
MGKVLATQEAESRGLWLETNTNKMLTNTPSQQQQQSGCDCVCPIIPATQGP